MTQYRPAQRSEPCTPAQLRDLVLDQYLAQVPGFSMLTLCEHVRLLTAQAAFEGHAWNNNVGGLKRLNGLPWTSLGTHEVLPALTVTALIREGRARPPEPGKGPQKWPPGYAPVYLLPGPNASPATHFAAFDTMREGVDAWLLKVRSNYLTPDARKALDACDPMAWARALKARHYFTADASEYGRGVAKILEGIHEVPETFGDNFFGGGAR